MLNCVSPFCLACDWLLLQWSDDSPRHQQASGQTELYSFAYWEREGKFGCPWSHLTFYVYGESIYLLWIRKRHENSHVSSPNCSQLCCVTNNDSHIVFKVERGLKRQHNGDLKQNAERNQTCKCFSKKISYSGWFRSLYTMCLMQ